MTIVRRVGELETLPRGYGVAWWEMHGRCAVCLPIGLHAIASVIRYAYFKFRMWHLIDERERAWREGYERGREQGYRHGEAMGRIAAEEDMRSAIRAVRGAL